MFDHTCQSAQVTDFCIRNGCKSWLNRRRINRSFSNGVVVLVRWHFVFSMHHSTHGPWRRTMETVHRVTKEKYCN